MSRFLGCLIGLGREEKEMAKTVYRNVGSRSVCSESENWFQGTKQDVAMWPCPSDSVTQYAAFFFFFLLSW